MSYSRLLAAFLVALVVFTLAVDTYYLHTTDFQHFRHTSLFHLPKGGHDTNIHVKSKAWSHKRKFKWQEEDEDKTNKLPWMNKLAEDKGAEPKVNTAKVTKQQRDVALANLGKEPILKIFEQAKIPPLTPQEIDQLPTWQQIIELIGPHPVIGGLDTCEAYKQKVPAVERMMGSSGMFNTGTNLVTHLLKNNCKIPERVEKYGPDASREMHGMRWQVPWGKHSPAKYKEEHSTEKAKAINKEWIMPVVTMRHPYSWMHSMCKNGYTARWNHGRQGHNCPNLKPRGEWNEVTTRFADGRTEHSPSLAHLWNDWYKMYIEDAKYPRLFVRLEDLVFHAKETTTTICECVGGKMRTDRPFTYVVDSAKADSRGHDTSTGFTQAWIKYSKPMPPLGGFTQADYRAAKEALNVDYMKMFHYEHPPAN